MARRCCSVPFCDCVAFLLFVVNLHLLLLERSGTLLHSHTCSNPRAFVPFSSCVVWWRWGGYRLYSVKNSALFPVFLFLSLFLFGSFCRVQVIVVFVASPPGSPAAERTVGSARQGSCRRSRGAVALKQPRHARHTPWKAFVGHQPFLLLGNVFPH